MQFGAALEEKILCFQSALIFERLKFISTVWVTIIYFTELFDIDLAIGGYSKRKEFAPSWSKFFPIGVAPFFKRF